MNQHTHTSCRFFPQKVEKEKKKKFGGAITRNLSEIFVILLTFFCVYTFFNGIMKQQQAQGNIFYHILAAMVVLTWGVTFVNTKKLIMEGMTPEEIFMVRFILAYVCIWFISPRKLLCDNLKDEGIMLLLGITGGSAYFLFENMAVGISYTNNVAFIVCTAPLITTLLGLAMVKDIKATSRLIAGSLIALAGTAAVIFNGKFVLRLNPLGDMLALGAAVVWAIYSLVMKGVTERYSATFITRKVFFYGIITTLPVFAIRHWSFPFDGFANPTIWGNCLFLGFVASFACFVLWNLCINKIGAIGASNYIYLNPVSTLFASALVLNEPMTWIAYCGSGLILLGVYIANRRT